MSTTSLTNTRESVDGMLATVSNARNFIERKTFEGMLDQLIESAEEERQQTLREFSYDLLVAAAQVEDLVISKTRAVDVLLDIRNSDLL